MIARFLREPLVHFLLLGAALFAVGALRGQGQAPAAAGPRRIEIAPERVEALAASFHAIWQRSPTREELDGLVEDFVEDELYYREALAMGLAEDDAIVRRRLRQKLEFLNAEVGAVPPTEEELAAYLAAHAGDFRLDGRPRGLDEVRHEVEQAWLAERRERAAAEYTRELRRRYQVVVHMPAADAGDEAAEEAR